MPAPAYGSRRRRTRRWLSLAAAVVVLLAALVFGFAIRLARVRALAETGPAWSFPARVYSDGVAFVPGTVLPPEHLRAELVARGYVESPRPLSRAGTYAFDRTGAEIVTREFEPIPGGPVLWVSRHLRLTLGAGRLVALDSLHVTPHARVGTLGLEPVLIARFYDRDRVRRTWVPLARVPKVARDAIVAAEDRRFRLHMGLDLRSNLRAIVANLRAGGVREGASTITQQLARGLFLGSQRTVSRKLTEMAMAVGLELLLSKDEILELYLNSIYWGRAGGLGIAGIGEASRFYFDTPVDSLNLAQAALLAGLIPAPNSSSPFRNPHMARVRRNAALGEMLEAGVIDAAAARRVREAPLPRHPGGFEPDRFVSYVGAVHEALRVLPREAVERHGLIVMSGLDLVWQSEAEQGLSDGLDALEARIGRRDAPLEGAFVAMDPLDGEVRALVGGRDVRSGDFDRATQARRQCGSAIKPIVYAIALDPGRPGPRFTPASTFADLRRSFPTPEGPWTPQNDDGEYHDTVTLAKALTHSINVATANLVDSLGAGTVAREATRFGLSGLKPVASIGLGSNEVTLQDLVGAYAVFPSGGTRHEVTPLRRVFDARGHVLLEPVTASARVIPASTAAVMTGLLEDVVTFGIAYPLRSTFGITRPLGGKTGTTNDYHDGWFVGFTPEMVAGVWVGYDTPQSLNAPAKDTALPLWAGILIPMLAGRPPTPFESDQGLESVWIDPWSGGRARSDCPSKLRVGFLPGSAPTRMCARDHTADWEAKLSKQFADSLAAIGDSSGAEY